MLKISDISFYTLVFSILLLGQDILLLPFNGTSIAEPLIVISFLFSLYNIKKISFSDVFFIIIIAFYILSSFTSSSILDGGVQYQLKNYIFFLVLYLTTKNVCQTEPRYLTLISAVILSVSLMIILSLMNGLNYGILKFATNRAIDVFPGIKWNGLVAIISLIFPIVLHFHLKKMKVLLLPAYFFLTFLLFVVVLSGGRQALLTIAITSTIQIFFQKNDLKNKTKLFMFLFCFIMYVLSEFITKIYFSDFYSFSQSKMENIFVDFYQVRLLGGFVYPLLEFDLLNYFFLGDTINNKHNIFTTMLYKIGFIGCFIFFSHYFYIYLKMRRISSEYSSLAFLVFVSFFLTNLIANIWYQVFQYGYFFWILIALIESKILINYNRDNL